MRGGGRGLSALAAVLLGTTVPAVAAPLSAQEVRETGAAGPPLRLSLEEAVRRATIRNEQVSIARAEQARTEGIVKEIRADALPQIDVDFGMTRNVLTPVLFFGQDQVSIGNDNEYSFTANLSQTLLDFSLGPARRAARLSRRATAAQVETARTDVALAARTGYYQVLLDRELVRVQEQALEQAQARLEQVESFFRAGTGSEFDLLTAQVEVDNIRPQLIAARNRFQLDLNRLKRTIAVSQDRELVLTDSLKPPTGGYVTLQEAVRRAMAARPDLQGQRVTVELQQENLASIRGDALPELSFSAAFQRRASSEEFIPPQEDFSQTITGALALSFPLFDGGARAGREHQAAASLERERFRLEQLREQVRLDVQQAHQNLQSALEQIEATRTNVRRAERALEIAQARFAHGLSTQVELDDAELAVTEARTNYAQALFDYRAAEAALTAAMGER